MTVWFFFLFVRFFFPPSPFQLFPRKVACKRDASPGSFFARDNTANFLAWCRHIGVEETYLFESEGLGKERLHSFIAFCALTLGALGSCLGVL